jgi:hypothetical protein
LTRCALWLPVLLALAIPSEAYAKGSRVSVVLRWKAVPTARSYELQIAPDRAFTEVLVGTRVPTAAYRWQQAPATVHWWRVRSIDADGREGPWSPPSTVQVDALTPTPVAPTDGATVPCGQAVTFTLEPAPSAKGFVVELSRTPDFSAVHVQQRAASTTVSVELGAGTWHWRARAVVGSSEALSDPSPVRRLTVSLDAPKPKATAETVLGVPVTLAWAEVACARSWAVEVTSPSGQKASLTSTTLGAAFKPALPGDHRWRVAAVDEAGAVSAWSAESVLRVGLAAPEPQAEPLGALELRWAAVAGATSYRVELSTSRTFKQLVASAQTSATTYPLPTTIEGQLYWRVQAKDARGRSSAYSAPREVQRAPSASAPPPRAPPPTRLTRPDADAEVASSMVDVAWEPSAGASGYELEVDGAVTPAQGTPPSIGPLPDGAHTLRVRALGEGGASSDWSAPLRFSVVMPVAGAEASADEREVRVVLKDATGRALLGRRPTLRVQRGALGAPVEREGGYIAPWTPPADGRDVLRVEERGAVFEVPLARAERTVKASLAVRAGWLSNLTSVSSPTVAVGATWRLPVLGRRLGVEGRVGVFRSQLDVDLGVEQVSGTAWAVPVSALLSWAQPVGPVVLRGGAGPALTPVLLRVGGASEATLRPGVELALGGGVRLGPGELELEVAWLWSPTLDGALARLAAGGLAVRLGYAFDLGGR